MSDLTSRKCFKVYLLRGSWRLRLRLDRCCHHSTVFKLGLAIIEVRLCNVHVWVLVNALLSMEEFPEPFKAIRHSHVRTRAHCSKGVSGMYWVRLEVRRCHV